LHDRLVFGCLPCKTLAAHGTSYQIDVSNCSQESNKEKTEERDTVLLIGTPLTKLLPLLRLGLASLTRRSISRIRILSLGAEEFALQVTSVNLPVTRTW
jgi:hypothetical protein